MLLHNTATVVTLGSVDVVRQAVVRRHRYSRDRIPLNELTPHFEDVYLSTISPDHFGSVLFFKILFLLRFCFPFC